MDFGLVAIRAIHDTKLPDRPMPIGRVGLGNLCEKPLVNVRIDISTEQEILSSEIAYVRLKACQASRKARLASMFSHAPNKGHQVVRCYGHNGTVFGKSRTGWVRPCMLQAEASSKEYRKNRARFIQQIFHRATDFNNLSLVPKELLPLSTTIR